MPWRTMNRRQRRLSASLSGKGRSSSSRTTHRREDRGMGRSHGCGSPLLTATSSWSRCPWIPTTGGKRIGSALVHGAVDRGRAEGFTGVVLTTFRDIPWNGPLYRHLGFETMQDAEIGPELRAIRRRETEAGLDVLERECLRKRITH